MKGLESIPSATELLQAYEAFQSQAQTHALMLAPLSAVISVESLALWSQWCRFDARLAEQWISYCALHWKRLSAVALGEHLGGQPWPAAAGVLLEHVATFLVPRRERLAFRAWSASVMVGIAPANHEQYLIGTRALSGKLMREDSERSLSLYRRWGYLGRDLLLNKAQARRPLVTLLGPEIRRVILDELIAARPRFRVSDYVAAAGGLIGLRQAQLDIAQHPKLRAQGETRGKVFRRLR